MPNLDPWVNQNNNDYEGMTTKTVGGYYNPIWSLIFSFNLGIN